MAFYRTCPDCGASLDPGEKCTCMEEKAEQQDLFSRHLKRTGNGQLEFTFDGGDPTASLAGRRWDER